MENFKFFNSVKSCGPWDGSGCVMDIDMDIAEAAKNLPAFDRPAFLLVNRRNDCQLNAQYHFIDYAPVWTSIIHHFIALPYVPTKRIDILNIIRPLIIRLSDELDDHTAVLVSERGNAVKIEV